MRLSASRTVACGLVLSFACGVSRASAQTQTQSGPIPESPPASQAPPPGLKDLLKATVTDFERLASTDTAKMLAVGGAAAYFGQSADTGSSRALSRSQMADRMLGPGEWIGGARLQLAGALATYGVGRLTKSSTVATVGGDLLRAQFMAQVLTAGIKLSARRARPDGTQFSFPSGHTSVSFATATVLQRDLGPKFGIPAYAVATYVAASRIQDKRHFLSDVAFGAAIGILSGRTVTVGRGKAKFAVTPTAVPGGGGLSFDLIGR